MKAVTKICRKMIKNRLLIICVFLGVLTCNLSSKAGERIFYPNDSTVINGKIIGFKNDTDDKLISFYCYNLSGKSQNKSIRINADGSFSGKLFQPYEGEIDIKYKKIFTKAYVKPGKELCLVIDSKEAELRGNFTKALNAKGDLAEINNKIFDFMSEFQRHKFVTKARLGDKSQTDSLFSSQRLILMNENLEFLSQYLKQTNNNNQGFANWAKNYLVYEAAYEIVLFPFFGKENKDISMSKLLGCLGPIPINNPEALKNAFYYRFLDALATSLQIVLRTNNENVSVFLDKSNGVFTGIAKELVYYDIYSSRVLLNPTKINENWDRFFRTVSNSYLKSLFLELKNKATSASAFKSFDIIAAIDKFDAPNNLKERLIQVFKEEKGKTLYIDFWGTWCAPCMLEMPVYPSLIDAYKNKAITFIFFAVDESEKRINELKEKYKIAGKFVLLSKDETAVMNDVLNFQTYPSHFIIDSKGLVRIEISRHLSSENVDSYFIPEINKYID